MGIHTIEEHDPLERRILEFFADNPDEALTCNDVRIKFGHLAHRAAAVLKDMCERSLLRREPCNRGSELEYLYTKG
jgi:hypothetical protein